MNRSQRCGISRVEERANCVIDKAWIPERCSRAHVYKVSGLSAFIEQFVGVEGVIIFAVGFIAASLSSQLTMPIGATVLIESVWFHWDRVDEEKAEGRVVAELEVKEKSGGPVSEIPSKAQVERRCFVMKQIINFAMVIIATVVISTNGETSF